MCAQSGVSRPKPTDLAQLSVSTSNRSASRKGFLKTYTIRYHKMPKYITVFG